MKFIIDNETYNDLEIFNSPERSIFSILNSTKTEGGERLLNQMMREVMNDVDEIEARRDLIKFFCRERIDLNIRASQMENIDFYLSYLNTNCLKNNIIDSIYDHWSYKINPTQSYYQITTGVRDLIQLLGLVSKFVVKIRDVPGFQSNILMGIEDLDRLLSDHVIARNINPKSKIGYRDLSYLDDLFRRSEKETVKPIVQWTYKIDMAISLARLVNEKGWCLPQYLRTERNALRFEGLYHPSIQDCVSNDYTISSQSNVTFLTGPNMAGKSSFLKTIGISIYLAHLGFPVPAKSLSTPVFNGLVTTINLPDKINEGLSHFYSEAQRIRSTAIKLSEGGRLFVIFDELFRGTNLKDAFEATVQLVSSLTKIKHSVFIVSSHLVDVIPELNKVKGVTFNCFDCSFTDGRPKFSYKIKEGASNERLGMYILRNEGIFETLKEAAGNQI